MVGIIKFQTSQMTSRYPTTSKKLKGRIDQLN